MGDGLIDSRMKNSFYLILLAAGAVAFSSCNTFIGMGRDIQSMGAGMQNTGHGKTWDGQQKQAPQAAQPGVQQVPMPQ